jgi:hypothetical protein
MKSKVIYEDVLVAHIMRQQDAPHPWLPVFDKIRHQRRFYRIQIEKFRIASRRNMTMKTILAKRIHWDIRWE